MSTNYLIILPELILATFGLLGILLGIFLKNKSYSYLMILAKVAMLIALVVLFILPKNSITIMSGFFITNYLAILIKILLLSGSLLYLTIIHRPLEEENLSYFEFPILIMFCVLGMMVMISANDLLSLFMGLELQNLCLYTLVAFKSESPVASEAGLKYFLTGAIASGILLFGISVLYGLTGSTNYSVLVKFFESDLQNMATMIGVFFIFIGVFFKLSLAPFHCWAPDVYEGTPTPITMFVASIPKLVALGVLANLSFYPFENLITYWRFLLLGVSIVSMILGSLAALRQDNIKRLLAYSAIYNIGFAVMGISTNTIYGLQSSLLYIVFYILMILGLFGCILNMSHRGHTVEYLHALRGIGKNYPITTFTFIFIIFSMAGIPPLPGFFVKIYVLQDVLKQHAYGVAIVAILTSVISAAYYLIIVKSTLFDKAAEKIEIQHKSSNYSISTALFIIIFLLIYACISPDSILRPLSK